MIKDQGFIPHPDYESASDEEDSDEYENDAETESDDDNSNIYFRSRNERSTRNGYKRPTKYKDNSFVIEDPFFEVKDEHIDHLDESSTEETQLIHLKNGFIISGRFRKRRRCGLGRLAGPSLEAKGIEWDLLVKICTHYQTIEIWIKV